MQALQSPALHFCFQAPSTERADDASVELGHHHLLPRVGVDDGVVTLRIIGCIARCPMSAIALHCGLENALVEYFRQ